MPAAAPPAFELRGIVKRFGGVVAVDGVDLAVAPGEIRALLGENGAGKSTLMRVLYGLETPDAGEISVGGRRRDFRSAADAIGAGLGMVHQHFMLFDSLTVAENVVFGREPRRRGRLDGGLFDRRTAERRVAELGARFGLPVDPRARAGDLPAGLQQRLEILKALYREARVLILDEPTAVLSPPERDALFRVLRDLAESGRTIVFISHKLQEVMDLAERATVMRDGRVTATVEVAGTSPEALCRHMVGRDVALRPGRPPGQRVSEVPVLEVRDLTVCDPSGRRRLDGVSFEVRAGEIVGVAGVAGNGQSELVAALAGLGRTDGGRVTLAGREVTHASVAERRRYGLAYVPEDTAGVGLALGMSVADNLILGEGHRALGRRGLLPAAGVRALAERRAGRFTVKTASLAEPAAHLSGGNRQKLVLARELAQNPAILIAEQPTQGIDAGAAEAVHRHLLAARGEGRAVLLVSAELGELIALSDRILVMFEGRIVGVMAAEAADEETLGMLAAGRTAA